ncbi:copper resistance protein B [Sphingomonas sp. DBB INV C78]|uniref:copper resistance protein B n=1 Tax=Sphingomonas sp. DBB INV C78 TaxID=3349434 RepID=UPI0036D42107
MKPVLLALLLTIAAPALAQHQGHDMSAAPPTDPHAGHDMGTAQPADPHAGHDMSATPPVDPHAGHDMAAPDATPIAPPPPGALAGPKYAADGSFDPAAMAAARRQLQREHGGGLNHVLMIERLEARIGDGADAWLWDAQGWYGGDVDKLWVKTEGESEFGGPLEQAEVQALWSHAIDPWFDLQLGIRTDLKPEPERAHLVVGIQGLAPYWFEVDGALFLSDKGDLTARLEAEYDQRITQKLIVQPRAEIDLAAQDVPELGIEAGLSSIEAGVRVRYEFVPEFAPYIGVEYERQNRDGGNEGGWRALVGLRVWL